MDTYLVKEFRQSGYDVVTAADAGLLRTRDDLVVKGATRLGRAVLTFNCGDFQIVHKQDPNHAGILVSYTDGTQYMTNREIVWAVTNRVVAEQPIPRNLHVLNQWGYYQPDFKALRKKSEE